MSRIEIFQGLALTKANLKSRYRNSFTGFLWVVLNPLLIFSVQGFAFHIILKINVDQFPLFLMTGLLPWLFIAQTIEMSAPALQSNGRLLKSFQLKPSIFIFSQVFDNSINFFAAMLIAFIGIGIYGEIIWWHLLFLPLCLIPLTAATLSMCWLIAGSQVLIKDLRFFVSFLLNVSYFITPIFYPPEFAPENWRWIFAINPIYYFIVPFRQMAANPLDLAFWMALARASVLAVIFLLCATWFWRKKKNAIYFSL
jgi:ABC-type polysaccharide/polyol phosphate export permease